MKSAKEGGEERDEDGRVEGEGEEGDEDGREMRER